MGTYNPNYKYTSIGLRGLISTVITGVMCSRNLQGSPVVRFTLFLVLGSLTE